ncbi:hypothetical protein BDW02DRAFT_580226 [Decorospora gaudefroyi]|uniref:Putative zinc-finger domain-containing protein n=1 Tax=Decorospora gaudefroyi TaxID=184978 RepID=A0A6A5K750_9PLEO|nr:hypothetical protein BDW02DRAFT_580226 [Decorospora gaudefroyi]
MANNYSQPFYGFSHRYPLPPLPPPAQSQEGAFPQIPGLAPAPPPGVAGINSASYAQNSQQQPPFPAPAWPPQFPPDPNLWALFQSGAFPPPNPNALPPPFPHMAFPPPSLPHTPQNHALATPLHSQFPPRPPQPAAVASERIREVMDSDREDGELSEGDVSSQPPTAKSNGRAQFEPSPRSVPQASHTSAPAQNGHTPHRPPASQPAPKETPLEAPQRDASPTPLERVQKDREDAKQFIKLLHSHNIPYRALANEKLDMELLRGLYQSVNLPSEPAPILPPKPNGTSTAPAVQPALPAHGLPPKPPAAVKTDINAAPSTKPAASPTAPGDRKNYIARLQAAKAAKQAGLAKPSPPQQTPPAKSITPAPATKTPQPATTPNAKAPVTDEQRARNTELIKQRLEAIKAKQKLSGTASNGAVPAQQTGQTPGPPEQTTRPAPSGTNTPTNQGYMPPFSGIPGLFMSAPHISSSSASIVSQPSSSVPQKRPAPTDTAEVATPRGSVTPYTRPLGQSPHAHQQDDSMIIDVSEDESNGSEMDIEMDQPAPKTAHDPRQALGNLSNFPSRAGSAMRVISAATTPGAQTPTIVAREKELVDKEKQLVAMRETLKKKLAEKKRERDNAAAAAATPLPTSNNAPTPVLPVSTDTLSKLPTTTTELAPPMPVQSVNASADATRPNVGSGKDTKRLRRAEIESRLPTLDAEIASNASRMAQLTKEMEQLTAQNEKIAKDKKQLTVELESLGVDTEGMSHAELRAKKNEIEREQSPEPQTSSHRADNAPQPLTNGPLSAVQSSLESLSSSAVENERAIFSTPLPTSSQVPHSYTTIPGLGRGTSEPRPPVAGDHVPTPTMNTTPTMIAPPTSTYEPQLSPQENVIQTDGPQVLPDAEEASVKVAMAPVTPGSATALDEDEDFYSPPPPAGTNLNMNTGETGDDDAARERLLTQPAAVSSPSEEGEVDEEGEVEMSVSEREDEGEEEFEPEYEPDEPAILTDVTTQEAQNAESEIPPSVPTSQVSTEDEEAYEPPDVDQEMSDFHSEAAVAQPSSLGHIEAGDGAMDIASSSSEDSSDESDSDEESSPEPRREETISANNLPRQDTNVADDLAPELQRGITPAAAVVDSLPVASDEDQLAKFTPYESPLRMFKSYRYHPSYAQDISGGFLSLTFSHQIDPEKPFCQYESAGGACNDPGCPDQHFRDVAITGDKLLVQLGTANPGKTSEEKQRWNDGLRGVLKELRQKNIKDPNGIAAEIARYRRQFLNDDTRVVNL